MEIVPLEGRNRPLQTEPCEGKLHVTIGCAGSGKSLQMAKIMIRKRRKHKRVAAFVHRFAVLSVRNMIGGAEGPLEFEVIEVHQPHDIVENVLVLKGGKVIATRVDIVGIDNGHMLSNGLKHSVDMLLSAGVQVFLAGRNTNFRGQAFADMAQLMAEADSLTRLPSSCSVCGERAVRSQMLLPGPNGAFVPAPWDTPSQTLVGGDGVRFVPRCRRHHEVPRRPSNQLS